MKDNSLIKLFAIISVVVIMVALGWVVSTYYYGKQGVQELVAERGEQLRQAYEADLATFSGFMLEIAEYVANDDSVNVLLKQGRDAVRDGDLVAADIAREKLLEHLAASWQHLNPTSNDRVMHFHLAPAISFLRVHQPDRYGDDLSTIRPTVVAVNQTREAMQGFESGRYFRGIRAVIPVWSRNPDGTSEHVGALEVGITLSFVLKELAEQSKTNFATFFYRDHITSTSAPERIADYRQNHEVFEKYYLNWSSVETLDLDMVNDFLSPIKGYGEGAKIYKTGEHAFGVALFPLHSMMPNLLSESASSQGDQVGMVAVWFPIDRQMTELTQRVVRTILIAILLTVLIEMMLYISLTREQRLRDERNASLTDALTGIGNRRSFDETFDQELRRATRSLSPITVILIDVDHFKKFNDNYGHRAGDDVLRQVAVAMKGSLRRAADFMGRYGGEEFVALLPDTDIDSGLLVADRLRKSVEDLEITHDYHESNTVVTVSVGICTGRVTDIENGHIMIESADRALYKAKEGGRNCVRSVPFSPAVESTAQALPLMYR